ncbi:hypothetical protein [Erwinia sp. 9145]|uniref:hypothetical protein n=1 Tax=Erwinia sp. 9145 TaxID=1500895 RepID=UPI00054E9F53|nr:hypothetical protein [Erwinia sp. 9145]
MALVYIPSLIGLLINAEQRKGSVLTRLEVEAIRDGSVCISVPDFIARSMEPACGYNDIDPQKCWEEWSRYRSRPQSPSGLSYG